MRATSRIRHRAPRQTTHPSHTLRILANQRVRAEFTSQIRTRIRTGGNQEDEPVTEESA